MSRLSSTSHVGTAPEQVFSLLRETRSWANWWRGVSHARTADLRPLREGSDLELTFAFGPVRLASKGRVYMMTDDRAISWRSPVLGIPVSWSFFLQPSHRGTRVEILIDLPLPTWLLRVTRLEAWWLRSSTRSLRQLKVLAERM